MTDPHKSAYPFYIEDHKVFAETQVGLKTSNNSNRKCAKGRRDILSKRRQVTFENSFAFHKSRTKQQKVH